MEFDCQSVGESTGGTIALGYYDGRSGPDRFRLQRDAARSWNDGNHLRAHICDKSAIRLWFASLIPYSLAPTIVSVYVPLTDIRAAADHDLPLGFLIKDVLFLVASFYLLKQDVARAALEITPS